MLYSLLAPTLSLDLSPESLLASARLIPGVIRKERGWGCVLE